MDRDLTQEEIDLLTEYYNLGNSFSKKVLNPDDYEKYKRKESLEEFILSLTPRIISNKAIFLDLSESGYGQSFITDIRLSIESFKKKLENKI